MKKSIVSSIVASVLAVSSSSALAVPDNSYQIRVFTKAKLSNWSSTAPTYHPWADVGSHYDCEIWSPDVNTINFGRSFNQSRACSQDQERDVDIKEKDAFSGEIKTVKTVQENKTITETENQNAVGMFRNWVSHSSTYTDWEDFGADHSHLAWSPSANIQTTDFIQSRDFKHDQERFEQKREIDTVTTDIRDTGSLIRHTKAVNRDESRPVDVEVTTWSDVGGHYGCAVWSPLPSTVDVYENFTQYRDCNQNQTRRWSYDSSGSEIYARMQNKTITETETQASTGTKRQWEVTDSTFTEWVDNGAHHTFGDWNTVPSNEIANYTQTRTVKQPQKRTEQKRELDAISGEIRNVGDTIFHNRNIDESESRVVSVSWSTWSDTTKNSYSAWSPLASAQTKSYTQSRTYSQNQTRNRIYKAEGGTIKTTAEVRTLASQVESRLVSVSSNSWSDTTRSAHTTWSPAASNQTSTFTQTRSYTQSQERTWSYKISGSEVHSRLETRNLTSQSESRGVSVSWSNWAITSGKVRYSCTTWSPATNTKGYNVSFTQSQSCKQDQARTRSYSVGGSFGEAKTITTSHTQGATGVGSWANHTPTYTSWVNGTAHSYGTYSPIASSQTANFSQSRGYKQPQSRTRQNREIDTISGAIRNVGSTINEARTLSLTQNRSIAVAATSWANTTKSAYSSWSPAASAQTSTFTQARSYTQNQSRTWTYKAGSSTIKTRIQTQALTGKSESRSVSVSWSNWAITSGKSRYSCTTWSPATNTIGHGVSFTQSQSCKQDQTRTRSYNVGGSFTEAKTITTSHTQGATGIGSWDTHTPSYTSWVNGTANNFGTWSPAASSQTASFSQSRTYKQPQTRTRQNREIDTISGAVRNIGSVINEARTLDLSQDRSVTVAANSWANTTKSGYSSWSPAVSSQTSTFTQTRSYTQNQSRTWSYKVGASTIHSRVQTQALTGKSESRTATVSWTSWVDSGGQYSCGSWSPATNTIGYGVSFTQSQSCKQNQSRTRSYNVGGSFAESRTINETNTRSATGIGSWDAHSPTYTSWVNNGSAHSYGSYSPAASSQTSNFTQSRSYKQPQKRTRQNREIDTISGAIRNTGSVINETRDLVSSQSRTIAVTVSGYANTSTSSVGSWSPAASSQTSSFTQTRSYTQNQSRTWTYKSGSSTTHTRAQTRALAGQSQSRSVTVSWTSWVDSGGQYSCGSWSPATNTKGYGVSFTQSQSCKQNQSRTRSYNVGGSFAESRTINETNNRSATGVGSWATHASSFSSWTNSGSAHSYGSYSPAASSQTSNFTQSRSYKQPQTRTRQNRQIDMISGNIRNTGSVINETRDLSLTSSRTVTVSGSGWSYHSNHSFGGYSPSMSTVCTGTRFTQTESYKRKEKYTYSYSIGGTHVIYRDLSNSRTRTSMGTKTCVNWVAAASTYSSWANNGSKIYGSWPALPQSTSSFSQSRSCSQPQRRTKYVRQKDTYSGRYRTTSTSYEYRATSCSSSRTVGISMSYIYTYTNSNKWLIEYRQPKYSYSVGGYWLGNFVEISREYMGGCGTGNQICR
jgi:hypothetical protein